MKKSEKRIPNYNVGEVYAWDAFLHRAIQHYKATGKEMTSEERSRIVTSYVQKTKGLAESVVVCPCCEEEIKRAAASGTRPGPDSETVRRIIASGHARRQGRRTASLKSGKAGLTHALSL